MLVATMGGGRATGFTLDSTDGEFVATHPDLRIPARGGCRTAGPVLRCKGAAALLSSCAVPAGGSTPVRTFSADDAWV